MRVCHFLLAALLVASPVAARAQMAEGVSFPADLSSKPISLNMVGKRVPMILDEIEKATGLLLSNSSGLNNEVLLAVVDKMPSDRLMLEIAKITGGVWIKTDEGYQLRRGPEELNALWSTEKVKVMADMTKKLERYAKTDAQVYDDKYLRSVYEEMKNETGDEKFNPQNFFEQMVGNQFLGNKIIGSIKPEDLIDLKVGERRLYSSVSMPQSSLLKPYITDTIRKLEVELAQKASAMSQTMGGSPIVAPKIVSTRIALSHTVPGTYTIKVWANLRNRSEPINSTIKIEVGGQDIQNMWAVAPVDSAPVNSGQVAGVEPNVAPLKPSWPIKPVMADRIIELSQVATAQYSLSRLFGAGQNPDVFIDLNLSGLISGTRQPDIHDPLSFLPGEMLRGIAKDQGKQMIALMPDQYALFNFLGFSQMGDGLLPKLTVKGCFDTLESTYPMNVRVENDLIVLAPKIKSFVIGQRMDRTALRGLYDSEKQNEGMRLSALMKFAQSYPEYSPLNDTTFMMIYLDSAGFSSMSQGSENYPAYRFLSSIPSQTVNLNEFRFTINDLNAVQRKLFVEMYFSDNSGGILGQAYQIAEAMSSGEGSVAPDEFLLMARGFSQNTIIRGNWTQEQIARVVDYGKTPIPMSFLSAMDIVGMRFSANEPEAQQYVDLMPKTDRLRPALSRKLLMSLDIENAVGTKLFMFSERYCTGPIVNFNQMPPEFLKAIKDAEKQMQGWRNGGGGSEEPAVAPPGMHF